MFCFFDIRWVVAIWFGAGSINNPTRRKRRYRRNGETVITNTRYWTCSSVRFAPVSNAFSVPAFGPTW